MKMTLSNQLPEYPVFAEGIRRAPDRGYTLSPAQTVTALKNALRYIPVELHRKLAPEFLEELRTRGRIYGYRFRPAGDLKAKPIDEYQGNCIEGKAFQVMIDNNLCFDIALYPYELQLLVTILLVRKWAGHGSVTCERPSHFKSVGPMV